MTIPEFTNGYTITVENDGYETIYVPRENGEVFPANTRLGRYMKTFKTPQGATKFLLTQGAILKPTAADLVAARIMSQPTQPRQAEDW